MSLSPENKALVERVFAWATPEQMPIACFPAIRFDELNDLLDEAREEGRQQVYAEEDPGPPPEPAPPPPDPKTPEGLAAWRARRGVKHYRDRS